MAATAAAAAALIAALLGLAGPARANPQQLSMMMDDNVLLYGSDHLRDYALGKMRNYGVDAVRVTIDWNVIADGARKTAARRRRFKPDDPRTYPKYNWDRYDRLVRTAHRLGLIVLFNVTGPGPSWTLTPTHSVVMRRSYKPKPGQFFKFVKALGIRYSGGYRDEDDGHAILPRVTFWSIWNEPNQPRTLSPQWERSPVTGKLIPYAPIIYRDLYWAATDALRVTGHGGDTILMGETAPLGLPQPGPHNRIYPKTFIRELFCIAPSGLPYTGADAQARRCDKLANHPPFLVSGWAHHPYTQRKAPSVRDGNPNSINMANVSELAPLLDEMAAKTGKIPGGLRVYLTEIGWETQDPYNGVPLEKQIEYMNLADFLAYRSPRVFGQTWFLLRDVPPQRKYARGSRLYWYTWQSGLFYSNWRPKPTLAAYVMPLIGYFTSRNPNGTGNVHLWGQLRFTPNGTQQPVYLQYRPQGSSTWVTAGAPVVVANDLGFYEADRVAPAPGVWRAVWLAGNGRTSFTSREVLVRF